MTTTSICELCNPARYADAQWMTHHRALEEYSTDKHVFMHTNGSQVYRKGWEWTQCIYGLDQFGIVNGSASGLGVGAGHEPLLFYFGDRIREVVALDLYGNDVWSNGPGGREANPEVMHNPERWCPKAMDFSRISFVTGSGTDLAFRDCQFDFCWSMSSIEHFGGHDAAARSMREMARVTKTGGIIALATEYLLLPEYDHPEYFNSQRLRDSIIEASRELKLVSPVDWKALPYEYLVDSIIVPAGVDRRRRHVVLNDGRVQWTSIMLFFQKL